MNEKIIRRQAELLQEIFAGLKKSVIGHGYPADRFLSHFFRKRRELGSRDRRFLSEAVFSWFRWLGWTARAGLPFPENAALAWLLDNECSHPVFESVIQSVWSPLGGNTLDDKAAALNAWFSSAAGFEKDHLIPPGFMEKIALPEGSGKLFYTALQQRPPTWLRLRNPAFKNALTEADISFQEHSVCSGAVAITGGAPLAALKQHGQYEVQDIASQAVALIAAPEEGSEWWDACAGAGGKALHLADCAGPSGRITATDLREEALRELRKRARQDGITQIRTQVHNLANGNPPAKKYDGVLVDAPCSGTGTWSRNPDARWRCNVRDPSQKRNLQIRMLSRAASCVKEGGRLVYAVCSITREETIEAAGRFMSDHPEFVIDPFINPLTGKQTAGTVQIFPWEGPGDGMYIARFRKT